MWRQWELHRIQPANRPHSYCNSFLGAMSLMKALCMLHFIITISSDQSPWVLLLSLFLSNMFNNSTWAHQLVSFTQTSSDILNILCFSWPLSLPRSSTYPLSPSPSFFASSNFIISASGKSFWAFCSLDEPPYPHTFSWRHYLFFAPHSCNVTLNCLSMQLTLSLLLVCKLCKLRGFVLFCSPDIQWSAWPKVGNY